MLKPVTTTEGEKEKREPLNPDLMTDSQDFENLQLLNLNAEIFALCKVGIHTSVPVDDSFCSREFVNLSS